MLNEAIIKGSFEAKAEALIRALREAVRVPGERMVKNLQRTENIVEMVIEGKISRRKAAEMLESSLRTVHNNVRKYRKFGREGLVDHRSGGRYRKLNPEKVKEIVACKAQRPHLSARWIRDWLGLDVSVERVRQVLVRQVSDRSLRP